MLIRRTSAHAFALTAILIAATGVHAQAPEVGAGAETLASAARTLAWRPIGPGVVSGRISDLAVHRNGGVGGGGGAHNGPYIIPGTYTASLATFDDGLLTEIGQPRSFEVFMLFEGQRTPEVMAFQTEVQRLQRAVVGANAAAGEAQSMVNDLETAFERVPLEQSDQIQNDIETLRSNLRSVQWELNGDPTARQRAEASPTSVSQRLGRITGGAWSGSLTEVTGMHREQYQVIGDEFVETLETLRILIEQDLKALQDLADQVGAPWTSGRIPVWSGVRIVS